MTFRVSNCICEECEPGLTRQQIGEQLDKDRALANQVGGDHYRRFKIQPVEYILANDIGFLAGNIIKYATRYTFKGGAEDVRKIIHYCELILEFEYPTQSEVSSNFDEAVKGLDDGDRTDQERRDAQGSGQIAWSANNPIGYQKGSG